MIYIDIHTHQPPVHPDDTAIVAANIRQASLAPVSAGYAVGIHPWEASTQLLHLLYKQAEQSNVVAIGETGLDKLSGPSLDLQTAVFEAHIELAIKLSKPLIIHCVKAWNELFKIRKNYDDSIPWIIHGYKNNGIIARQLLDRGFYLSFGLRFRQDALRLAWDARRLFAETDDARISIREVYTAIAEALQIQQESLAQQIETRFGEISYQRHNKPTVV